MIVVSFWSLCFSVLAADNGQEAAYPVGVSILKDMQEAPSTDSSERERKFEELFRSAGASDGQIRRLVVPEPLDKSRYLWRTRKALEAMQLNKSELQAILLGEESRFRDLGYNMEVTLPGRTDRTIVVATSLDAPGKQRTGIVDNWSACVLMSRVYMALKNRPLEHTVVFLGFAAEEQGCVGSDAYVSELSEEELARVDAMVLLECVGMAPPSIWAQMSHKGFQFVTCHAAKKSGLKIEKRWFLDQGGVVSDLMPFRAAGVPTLCLDGLDLSRSSILHTAEETVDVLSPEALQLTHRVLLDTLRMVDQFQRPLEEAQVISKWGEVEPEQAVTVKYRLYGPDGPEQVESKPKSKSKDGGKRSPPSSEKPAPTKAPRSGARQPAGGRPKERENGARFAPPNPAGADSSSGSNPPPDS